MNGTLVSLLRAAAMDDQRHWDEYIPSIQMAYNFAIHSSTGHSPFFLKTGRGMALPQTVFMPDDEPEGSLDEFLEIRRKAQNRAWALAKEKLGKVQAYNKAHYDQTARKRPIYIHDYVMVSNHVVRKGDKKKLTAKYEGYYRVLDVKYPNVTVCRLGFPESHARTIHVNRVKVAEPQPGIPILSPDTPLSEDIECIMCRGRWADGPAEDDWLMCQRCEAWLHVKCMWPGSDPDQNLYYCDDCNQQATGCGLAVSAEYPPINAVALRRL
jgi:hypothetical protein